MNQQILTKSTVQEILNKVFTEEDLETLKLTWADGTELSFEKQFFDRYEGKFLKYDLDKTKNLALSIYHDSVKQDLLKFEVIQAKLKEMKQESQEKFPRDFFGRNQRILIFIFIKVILNIEVNIFPTLGKRF